MAKRQVFRITDLSGGMNPDQNPVLIADNEAAEVFNFRIDKMGSLKSREGSTPYYEGGPGETILQLGRWSDGASNPSTQILFTVGTVIYRRNTTSTRVSIKTGVAPAAYSMFYPFQDVLVYTQNGAPLVYNGTGSFETLGINAPTVAPSGSTSGAGLTGVFQYAYTGYQSSTGWESNPSPTFTTGTLANQGMQLTLNRHTHPNVDKLRIYRTNTGGGTLQFLAEINNPVAATTTYTDNGPQTLSTIAIEYDNDPPPNLERVAYHKGYLFGTIGNTLYWSKPLRPNAWPSINSTEVPFESNDTITAIKSFQDTLIIFGNLNTILVAGDGGNWALIRQDVEIGCVGQEAIAEVGSGLVFMSYQGLRSFPGFDILGVKLNRLLNEYSPTIRQEAILSYVPEEYGLWLQIDNLTWVINLMNQALARTSVRYSKLLPGGIDGRGAHLRVRGVDILQYGGKTDPDSMQCIWRSKIYQMSNPEMVKHIRRIGLFAVSGQGSGSLATMTLGDTKNYYTVSLESVDGGTNTTWDFVWYDPGPPPIGDSWASEAAGYFIGSLPAQALLGRILQITIEGDADDAPFEVITPISIEFRESDRFLGAP